MKLASFRHGDTSSWGIAEGGNLLDLGAVMPAFPDLKAALSGALAGVAEARSAAPVLAVADVAFLPVIADPGKILCVGHNYESHRQETNRDRTDHPSIFVRFADSQVGHLEALVRPRVSSMFDYEGELAVVIGKPGRAIQERDALDHVAGYSCYMDASVRDWQWHTRQFTPGKTFPGTGGFGPFLVTRDELADPAATSVTTRLNGQVVQSQPTSDMIFPIPTIIAYVSAFTSLAPGDVIVTGTPGGVGAKRQPPLWLAPGDTVEVEIPLVGTLTHPVRAE